MLPLTVIICTYRREQAVSETLALLFGPKVQSMQSVDLRILLIDQGRTLQRTDFPQEWNLRLVQQENFGGAGGFARGMIEAMEEDAGWILLMDDDAIPDPDSFSILADYLRERAPDTKFALHGAMFSSEEPDTIYEAGAKIKEPRNRNFDVVQRLRGYKPNEPLNKDPRLWEDMEIDYGAWWFFCVHADTVRKVGLPLPLFIRGDDCEYGLRLKRAGIPTIPLPGLRIWHPEQHRRLDAWPIFFDQRNKLIIHALYFRGGEWNLAWKILYAGTRDILSARYDRAEMLLEGLIAYLRGPQELAQKPHAFPPLNRPDSTAVSCGATGNEPSHVDRRGPVRYFRKTRLVAQVCLLNGLWFPCKNSFQTPCYDAQGFDWLRTFRLKKYNISTSSGASQMFTRDRPRASCLLKNLFSRVLEFAACGERHAEAWRRSVRRLQTMEFWHEYLNLNSRKVSPVFNVVH